MSFGAVAVAAGIIALQPAFMTGAALGVTLVAIGLAISYSAAEQWGLLGTATTIIGALLLAGGARSASVIDRLLKNLNSLENRNNLGLSSPHPGPRPTSGGTAPQFCGPKFLDTGAMAVPIAGVRFGHSTTRLL